ncbi:hypothetical protein [Jiangella endophytica]|uniref:hypothetical protein n=1 Tax=Jiangella endophytica TaxID=1623398 RepID=UPI000E346FB6|nr:hypothetical protein [Jiangella endophytica]
MTSDADLPEPLQEACSWLRAAERHLGDPAADHELDDRLTAGEALDILTDITSPYSQPIHDRTPTPLPAVLPHILNTLSAAAGAAEVSVGERLRIAHAVRVLTRRRSG